MYHLQKFKHTDWKVCEITTNKESTAAQSCQKNKNKVIEI